MPSASSLQNKNHSQPLQRRGEPTDAKMAEKERKEWLSHQIKKQMQRFANSYICIFQFNYCFEQACIETNSYCFSNLQNCPKRSQNSTAFLSSEITSKHTKKQSLSFNSSIFANNQICIFLACYKNFFLNTIYDKTRRNSAKCVLCVLSNPLFSRFSFVYDSLKSE